MESTKEKFSLDNDMTFTILHCCLNCPNAGKWHKDFTKGVLHFSNCCQRFNGCQTYTTWWNTTIIDISKRLEPFDRVELKGSANNKIINPMENLKIG